MTDYAREIRAKNKRKIECETGNIYYNNINMQESIYYILLAQQDKIKKHMDYKIDIFRRLWLLSEQNYCSYY